MRNFTRLILSAVIGCGAMTTMAQTSEAPVLGGIYYGNAESALATMQYCTFNASTDLDFKQLSTDLPADADPTSGAVCGDKVFMFSNGSYSVYSMETGAAIEENVAFDYNPVVNAATYDKNDGLIYVLYWGNGSGVAGWGKGILSVNPETGDITPIAGLSSAYFPMSLAAAPDGTLYYIRGIDYVLATINKTNGECKDVTSTKILDKSFNMNALHSTSSAITSDGTMYTVSTDFTGTFLFKTNLETGVGELITDMPNQDHFLCLNVVSEGTQTGVANVAVENGSVISGRGYINATGFEGMIEVYSLDGRKVAEAEAELNVAVPAGVYVVRSGNTSVKTIVK